LNQANTDLPETIAPAINEKLMDAVQLHRIAGESLKGKQRDELVNLAFSCPLVAGNAVYRARTALRTWGNYTFDDAVICGLVEDKEEGGRKSKVSTSEVREAKDQWRVYPNPTHNRFWLKGPDGETLGQIQIYDGFGRLVFQQVGSEINRLELVLSPSLSVGMYFIVLQTADGNRQTRKLIIQP